MSPDAFAFETSTCLAFANGTSCEMNNTATLLHGFENVTDGESFYKAFAVQTSDQPPTPKPATPPATTPAPVAPLPVGYPSPVVQDASAALYAYLPNVQGLEDTAVLTVRTFEVQDPVQFQATAKKAIAALQARSKSSSEFSMD